jgi:hypothetical protein
MEQHLAEKISTIPEMRRFLAVKGYRELRERSSATSPARTALRPCRR